MLLKGDSWLLEMRRKDEEEIMLLEEKDAICDVSQQCSDFIKVINLFKIINLSKIVKSFF